MNIAVHNPKPKHKLSPASVEERSNELERRRELGQFFTPTGVVEFMWNFLEIIHGGAFPGNMRLIDPACGDGVFLRVAHERGHLPAGRLFGTDIDETLMPAWRHDPLLDGANVHLVNGLVDDPSLDLREGTFDIVAGNPPFSGKGMGDLLRLLEDCEETARHEEQDFFQASCLKEEATTARQPLSRQERAELDRLVRTLSRFDCWRLNAPVAEDDEVDAESVESSTDFFAGMVLNDKRRPTASDFERAAHLIVNWPLDRLLDSTRPEIRDVIRRLTSTAIEVFFTERFLRLTKPGGLIAVIVPESIVASDRLSPLRQWLIERMDVLATVGLPQKTFTGVGANARTTILFARRLRRGRPDGWWQEEAEDSSDADRIVLLTSPRLDSPNWSLDNYLAGVLESASKHDFRSTEK
jgi:type I restriction-modification system DNA methylase subunit